jgi:hypothetical protein
MWEELRGASCEGDRNCLASFQTPTMVSVSRRRIASVGICAGRKDALCYTFGA